jgi:GT2 family glycosyltransferase
LKHEYPQVRLIENSANVGFAGANNQAAAVAQGEYLFLLNADTELLDDGINEALRYARANRIAVLGPRTVGLAGTMLKTWDRHNSLFNYLWTILSGALFLKRFYSSDTQPSSPECPIPVGFLVGSAMLIDRNVYQRLGLFDERFFFTGEERDLCMRYSKADLKLVFFPGWSIFHHVGSGDGQSCFHFVNWIKSSRLLARKHGGVAGWGLMYVAMLLYTLTYWLALQIKFLGSPADATRKRWMADCGRILFWSIGLLSEKAVLTTGNRPRRVSTGA